MKAMMFAILAVLVLMPVSLAQKNDDVRALVVIAPASITVGETMHINVFLTNTSMRRVTVREIEIYCGTGSQWGECILTEDRVTLEPGAVNVNVYPEGIDYTPDCAGTWHMWCMLHFGGTKKSMIFPVTFTVEAPAVE